MPLLYREVNIVDLMLIEAVKIFFPEYYSFIKSNPEIFISSKAEMFGNIKINDVTESKQDLLNNLGTQFTLGQKKCCIKDYRGIISFKKRNFLS
jgi:predicted KAP-like P-loop ATPase